MRIGLVAPPWAPVPPHLYGGIELVVDRLAQGCAAAGHDVVLFTTGDSACPVEKRWLLEESEGVRIGFSVPEVRHVLAAYESLRDVDLIHDHSVLGPILSDHYTELPVVTTIHGELNGELRDIYERIAPTWRGAPVPLAHPRPAPTLPSARASPPASTTRNFPWAGAP